MHIESKSKLKDSAMGYAVWDNKTRAPATTKRYDSLKAAQAKRDELIAKFNAPERFRIKSL